MSPFEVLGVSPSITEAELKRVYRKLVKKYHPDHYKDGGVAFCKISKAYDEVLVLIKNKNNIQKSAKRVVIKHKDLFSFRKVSI